MNKIRKKRLELGLTQAELAKRLGIATTTVSMWEVSKRKPNIIMLKKIADIFRCSTDELLTDMEKIDRVNRKEETVSEREKRLASVAAETLKVIASNQLTVFEFNRVLVILKDLAEVRTIVQD